MLACEQTAARYQRTEAAGLPEVQAALRRQGRARGRAADQLRHHGRVTGAGCAARGVLCNHILRPYQSFMQSCITALSILDLSPHRVYLAVQHTVQRSMPF